MKFSKTLKVLFIAAVIFNLLYITGTAAQAYFKTPSAPPDLVLDAVLRIFHACYKITWDMTIFIFLFVHIFDLREEKEKVPLFDFEKRNDGIK